MANSTISNELVSSPAERDTNHLRQEHAVFVQTLTNDHQIALEALQDDHQTVIDQMRKDHRAALEQAAFDKQRAVTELQGAATALDADERQALKDEHAAALEAQRTMLSERHEATLVELRVGLNERYQESLEGFESDLRAEQRTNLEALQAEARATHKADQERLRTEIRTAHLNEMLRLEQDLRQSHETELARSAQTMTELHAVELDGVRASERARFDIELEHAEQQHQAALLSKAADHQVDHSRLRSQQQECLDAYRNEVAGWQEQQEAYYEQVLAEFARAEADRQALVDAHDAEVARFQTRLELLTQENTALRSQNEALTAERADELELARHQVAVVTEGYQKELAAAEAQAASAVGALIAEHATEVADLLDSHDNDIVGVSQELSLYYDDVVAEAIASTADQYETILRETSATHQEAVAHLVAEREEQRALFTASFAQAEELRRRVEELETDLSAQVVELTESHGRALEKAAQAVTATRDGAAARQAEFMADYEARLQAIVAENSVKTVELEQQYAELVDELRTTHADQIGVLKSSLDELAVEAQTDREIHEFAIHELSVAHQNEIEILQAAKNGEIERAINGYEDRLTALARSHKAELRSITRDHQEIQRETALTNADRLRELRADFEAASAEIERTHEVRFEALQRRFDRVNDERELVASNLS